MLFGGIFYAIADKECNNMKKTKIFAYNGKIGILGGDQTAPKTSHQSPNLVKIKNIQMTKEAFDIISELPKATQGDLVISTESDTFAWTGSESTMIDPSKIKTSLQFDPEQLRDRIVKTITYDEDDRGMFDLLVYAMR